MEKDDLLSAEELAGHYNVEISFLTSLQERGLIEIIVMEEKYYVHKAHLLNLEKMIRLHFELDINLEGIEAITHLLQRVESLQSTLRNIRNRLSLYEAQSGTAG